MKRLLAIWFILLLALPAWGQADAVKKKQTHKPRHAKKAAAVHPMKHADIQRRSKGSGDMTQMKNQDLQDTMQKNNKK